MMNDITINAKVDSLNELKAKIAELNKQAEAIKTELKKELDERKVDSVDTGLHKVFYTVFERTGVDTDKLKAAGLYDQYSKKSTVIEFKITDIKCKA